MARDSSKTSQATMKEKSCDICWCDTEFFFSLNRACAFELLGLEVCHVNNKGKLKGDRTGNITWQQNINEITNLTFDTLKGLILDSHNHCSF